MTRIIVLAFTLLTLSAQAASAAEPWADAELKVTQGLELWLDAAAQDKARTAKWQSTAGNQSPLAIWYDGSGQGRHASVQVRDARPRFIRLGDLAAVRFDGQDDHLAITKPAGPHKELTIFLLAAPKTNSGFFRAMFSAAQLLKNDFQTGLNIDLGPSPTTSFDVLNAEGAGFGGAQDLSNEAGEFGRFHVISLTAQPEKVAARIDGRPTGHRERQSPRAGAGAAAIHLETIVIGGRIYSNSEESPFVQGFLEGDIAEVLVYNRALSGEERKQVESYLLRKRDVLQRAMAESQLGFLLTAVKDPPPVQVLVPGFTVKQLPLDLTNINNIRYRPDGKLVALAYNGDVWLLSDSDGDGVEDKADLFWKNDGTITGPIGMALTPPGYARGEGLFFASKTALVLVVDTDADDRADQRITVAEGWEPSAHGVDALGVAVGEDGSIYFGIGTAWFAAPYLIDGKTGQSRYDVKGERGTILKVAPDFSSRQIVATGIRFPVALAFNREGDLFCTDQEGATWVPNGNPFDELLHIQPGRHYGFPARHPKHLPGVIDEPSVFDYAPQHQSTCGLVFNEPVNDSPVFGPEWWAGDAIVCGESRGKIYRTKLVKTSAGYVAQNQIIAALGMLTIDACVSPRGDLVVACHSGPADWGTGPDGKGKLYKISYADRQHAQPVLAWAQSETEVRIAFDRPLDTSHLGDLSKNVSITYGYGVRAGDRFETLWPGYAIVERQRATSRFHLPVHAVGMTPDRRTLILTTAPHSGAGAGPGAGGGEFAVTLPGMGRPATVADGQLPQHGAIDLDYTLTGVQAVWSDVDGQVRWSGWLPHPSSAVSRELTSQSAEHQVLWELVSQPGSLTLHTRLDLKDMLRPAVQPGSQIDFTLPPESVTVSFRGSSPVELSSGGDSVTVEKTDEPVEVHLTMATGSGEAALDISYHTNEDDRPRALPLRRVLVPWAQGGSQKPQLAARKIPQIEGGNWARGREIFFSDQALCAKCHTVGGRGGRIGPDLTNLIHRDYASVLRDIEQPSATLNPDHIAYNLTLADGRTLVGVPHTLPDGKVAIGDVAGVETVVGQGQVASMTALPVSIMPPSLNIVLGPEKFKDLMTFLMTQPLEPVELKAGNPPPPRSRAEVLAVLDAGDQTPGDQHESLDTLLVAGPKDHGPEEHDYPLWRERWSKLLSLADRVTVDTADTWPTDAQWEKADVIVFYQYGDWNSDRAQDIDAFLERGGGLVYLHWAVAGREQAEQFARRIGLAAGLIKFRHGPLDLSFTDHSITRGFKKAHFHDESYWLLKGNPADINVLATGVEDGKSWPLMWTRQAAPDKGRVFVSIPGHFTWTFDDPLFRVLVLRGIAWAAGQPTERLTDLATIGARITD